MAKVSRKTKKRKTGTLGSIAVIDVPAYEESEKPKLTPRRRQIVDAVAAHPEGIFFVDLAREVHMDASMIGRMVRYISADGYLAWRHAETGDMRRSIVHMPGTVATIDADEANSKLSPLKVRILRLVGEGYDTYSKISNQMNATSSYVRRVISILCSIGAISYAEGPRNIRIYSVTEAGHEMLRAHV